MGIQSKKINDHISFKISGSYLHAYEWEFISEDEWKSHQFAWVSAPNRQIDGKDNNPWNDPPLSSEDWDGTKRNYSGEDGQGNINGWNIDNLLC